MKINKQIVSLKKMTQEDDCFVEASPQDRISFVWELTAELWSLKGTENVERRLQRNITNFIKK